MKKLILLLFLFCCTDAFSQYSVKYEDSFRNYLPNQGWIMLSNDTIPYDPGLVVKGYSGEVIDYMLGIPSQTFYSYMNRTIGRTEKYMISPPIALADAPFLRFYSFVRTGAITVWLMRNENDTTIGGLTDSLMLASTNGFNVIDLSTAANDTVRFAFCLKGDTIGVFIDNMLVGNKESLAYIPDPCFRSYLNTIVPAAMNGDSLDYLHSQVLNTTQINKSNSCLQSVEGLQYFVNLRSLNLSFNQIDQLPGRVYTYIDTVILKNNLFTHLPDFPNSTYFDLDNNLLTAIPEISNNNCTLFHIRNNLFNGCLPGMNRFVNGDVCNNINVNRNGFYYYSMSCTYPYVPMTCYSPKGNIRGSVYFDVNQDSVYNAGDIYLRQQRINFYQGPDLYTNNLGLYSFETDSGLINMDVTQLPPYFSCANPLAAMLDSAGLIEHDFRIVANQNIVDWQVHIATSGTTNLGSVMSVFVDVRNIGSLSGSGTVFISLPHGYTVISAGQGTLSNDTISWALTLNPFQSASTQWWIQLDSLPTNQTSTFSASGVVVNDGNLLNNYSETKVFILPAPQVFSSWDGGGFPHDPNNKLVSTPRVSPGYSDWLDYVINFENTGTVNATRVMIRDQFPASVDPYSIEIMGASHPCTIACATDSIIEFLFPQISLTPHSVDSVYSKGHVWFRIKPSSPVQIGDTIKNRAAIYFDTQPAVLTEYSKVWADTVLRYPTCVQFVPDSLTLVTGQSPVSFAVLLIYSDGSFAEITTDSATAISILDNTIALLNGGTITPMIAGNTFLVVNYGDFTDTIPVSVTIFNHLSSSNFENDLKVFPNPFSEQLNILFTGAFENVKIAVTDMLGKTMIEKEFVKSPSGMYELPTEELRSGTYILRTETELGQQQILIRKM